MLGEKREELCWERGGEEAGRPEGEAVAISRCEDAGGKNSLLGKTLLGTEENASVYLSAKPQKQVFLSLQLAQVS